MSTIPPSNPQRPASCPRCAYDLAGAVALWKDTCDLQGTCPECGLDFHWRDVMNPMHVMPRWFFENPVRSGAIAFLQTFARMLGPHRFWSRINMALPIHIRRLVLMLAFLLLVTHVLLAAGAAFVASRTLRPFILSPANSIPTPAADIYAHVFVWPYSPRDVQVTQTIVISGNSLVGYRPGSAAGLRRQSYTYPVRIRSAAENGIVAATLPFILMPLTYLVLRQTLRRTRVRPIHLFRVFAYSIVFFVPLVVLQFLLSDNRWNYASPWGAGPTGILGLGIELPDLGPSWLIMLIAQLIVLGVWWRAATTRYLRLPHATGVAAAMLTITALGSCLWLVLSLGGALFGSY